MARTILPCDADADDAAQEAVIRGWRRRDSCREPTRYLAWLGEIARREALRARGRRRADGELEEARLGTDEELDERLQRLGLEPLLAGLPPLERALLELRYREDLTYREVASRLEIPVGTAKVRLHRLQKRLRVLLAESEWPPKQKTPA